MLADVPAILILIGLAAYAVLAGADFGAGFWQLLGGRRDEDREVREFAHHAMGPVWEANHVWLIFVFVVCWTAYPTAFSSIASTLSIPLFIAAIGIILRGTAYALRSGTANAREQRMVEVAFAGSSILTPFALGTVVGGIASGRVPVGNAAGDRWSSWLNGTSVTLGVLFVATAAYLAAVYLAADAVRLGRPHLERVFRVRALAMAVIAGGAAVAGLVVVHGDAHRIFDGLTSGSGLGAVIVSGLAGVATVGLVVARRYGWARVSAATAVAAIVAGWGIAQRPELLPGLTIHEAAAGHSTLVAMIVALAIGGVILGPSLGLLFSLLLRGRFDEGTPAAPVVLRPGKDREAQLLRAAALCGVVGVITTIVPDSAWGRIVGIPLLLAFIAFGFVALARSLAAAAE
jgi:cytochrome bd ubiquinol oxidase subunit II